MGRGNQPDTADEAVKAPVALIDCNNFYASCERVFDPALQGAALAVLSNNDGCVIARSEEAKRMGVAMGMPMHHIPRDLFARGLLLRSSNYELYGDMSRRVLGVLQEFAPRVEPYSIDESWVALSGLEGDALVATCHRLRKLVLRWTGIQVSIGVGPSRTLAKLANRHAKCHPATRGVFVIERADSPDVLALLSRTAVNEVWGVGARASARLFDMGVLTALDLACADPALIRRRFSVVLERTSRELAGMYCIDMLDEREGKKMIMTSRSFGRACTDRRQVAESLVVHASRGAEKLRRQGSLACALTVILRTNRFAQNEVVHRDTALVALPRPTDNTFDIVRAVHRALARIWQPGVRYHKSGVMLMDLINETHQQLDVFQPPQSDTDRRRSDGLMATLDDLNRRFGREAVTVGYRHPPEEAAWRMRSCFCSRRWTTRIEESPSARLE